MTTPYEPVFWTYSKFTSAEGHVTFDIHKSDAQLDSTGRFDVAFSQVFSTYLGESVDKQESIARLMAAAPALLAALNRFVQMFQGDAYRKYYKVEIAQAKEAIAQAIGETK